MTKLDLLQMAKNCRPAQLHSMRQQALAKGREALDIARTEKQIPAYNAMCLLLDLKNGGLSMAELHALVSELEGYVQASKALSST